MGRNLTFICPETTGTSEVCYEAQVLRIVLHVNRRRKLRTLTLIHLVVNPNTHELTYCDKLGSFLNRLI